MFVSGWVVRVDGRCAAFGRYQKLVLTGERHYTRNDDESVRRYWLWARREPSFMTQDVNIIQSQIERFSRGLKQASVRKNMA